MVQEDRIRLPTLNLIHRRSRLLEMLAGFVETGNRLITVFAPGGYGKSSLLADFAQTTSLPVCWCSLESSDRDPTAFFTLLAYSIADRFYTIEPDQLLELIERGDTQNSIHRVAELLAQVGPHLIIVDDFHKASSAGMILALNRLLERLPTTSTMIVAARNDVPLEAGQLIDLLHAESSTGLFEDTLGFTAAELQRVIHKRFGRRLALKDAEEIAQVTAGNIAEILLTGHVAHSEQVIIRLKQPGTDRRETIYAYLAHEVLAKQPPELQQFLLYTSVLPEMTVATCDQLLGTTAAQTQIEQLLRQDLFITQAGTGYRYHDLFAEFLRHKLAEDESRFRAVSNKAAHLLAEQARYEEAINLYLAVQAWDQATALLEQQGKYFYDTGRALTLNAWLEQISEEELDQRPQLLLLRGQILNSDLGDPKAAMDYFQNAENKFLEQGNLIAGAEALIWQSYGLWMMGRANESIALADMGLKQLEALNADERIIAWAIKTRGSARSIAGDKPNALKDLRCALELFEALGDTHRVGSCHHEIGTCLDIQGNISAANYHFRQELRIWETLGNANQLANTLNSLGVTLYNVGRYDEALRNFNECLDISLQIGATFRAALAQAGIGDVYLAQREYRNAIEAYSVSTQLAQSASAQPLEIYNLVKLGECHFQQNDLKGALNFAGAAMEIATETGLAYEKGLASALSARVYVRRGAYGLGSELFAELDRFFAKNDVLEHAKARLWWAYSLLLDLRVVAAYEQLKQAINLALNMGELIHGLRPTVGETRRLLIHFLHWPDTPEGVRDSIRVLLDQSQKRLNIASPSLQIFTLRTPYLNVAGEFRQFSPRGGASKSPELLAYLLIEGRERGCRSDQVSAAIWPDLPREKATVSFHQALYRLRQTIFQTPDYVVVRDGYYRVNPEYLDWCDALAFDVLYRRVANAPVEKRLDLQLELLSLNRGEFLARIDLGEWGMARRRSYERRFLETVSLAGQQLLKVDEAHQTLAIVHEGLARNFFREDLHQLVLQAYAQLGLHEDIKRHYFHLRDVLQQELGISPDRRTTHLFQILTASRYPIRT